MQVDPQITEIEARASEAKVQMASVLRDAGVAATTWWRWREAKTEPKLGTLRRVQRALDQRLSAQTSEAA